MQIIAKMSRTKVARIMGAALLLALVVTYVGATQAATPVEFTVRVFKGDPANHVMVNGANILLVADDRSNPSHGLSATTNEMGLAVFSSVEPGAFNVEIRHPDFYNKDYHILIDSNTELDATLVPLENTTPPPSGNPDTCTPTPPRGQPMFNIWPIAETGQNCTDYPLLTAQNVTDAGGYTHNISGSSGDIIKVRLYVHNGTLDFPENTAINAMVAAHLPQAAGEITAEAWANNAARITSAQKGGNVAVALGSNEYLEYVPGSAKVYSRGPVLIGSFPDSVVGAGASLGNMRGCYEFLRFVTFDVAVKTRVTPPSEQPTIAIQKTVRNLSRGETAFAETTQASPSEQVEFQVAVTASNATARNVVVADTLPANLSLNYITNTHAANSVIASIALGDIAAGATKSFRIAATAASAANFAAGSTTLTNTATARASNATSVTDTASVTVLKGAANPNLAIEKRVRNISDSETEFSKNTTASPGEQVEFEIKLSASQATARNVVMTDTLPNHFSVAYVNMDSGITRDASSLTFRMGDIATGSSKTVRIVANIASESVFPVGSSNWINNATATSENTGNVSSSATVTVVRGQVTQNAQLSITKQVRNLNSNNSFAHSTNAQTNDRLEFQITVRSTGTATASNVRVSDILPSQVSYSDSTFRLNGSYTSSGNFHSSYLNVSLGNLNPGQTATINFQVTVLSFAAGSQTTITNTATATADNAPSVSDTASVFLSSVQGTDINLLLSKRAYNNTQNADATTVTARPGDVITYTLTVHNTGSAAATSYVFQDDIKDILELSELGNFSGANFDLGRMILTWPAVNIPAGGKAEKTFTVTVRETFPAGTDFIMTNTFGNTVNVKVRGPFTAPATGGPATLSFILSGLVAATYAAYRKGKLRFLPGFNKNN